MRGTIRANHQQEAIAVLERRGYYVRTLTEVKEVKEIKNTGSSGIMRDGGSLSESPYDGESPWSQLESSKLSQLNFPETGRRHTHLPSRPGSQDDRMKSRRRSKVGTAPKKAEPIALTISRYLPIPAYDIMAFLGVLSRLWDAGIPYGRSLIVIVEQTHNPYFQEILNEIKEMVYEGFDVSRAMSHYPRVFSEKIIAMMRCGEETGEMGKILNKAAEMKEKEVQLLRNIKQRAMYPALILVSMLIFVIIMSGIMINIIFQALHMDYSELPLLTKVMLVSYRIITHPILVAVVLIGIPGLIYYIRQKGLTESFMSRLDAIFISLPLLGPLLHKISLSRFCDSMSDLLDSGISLPKAIDLAAKASGNRVLMRDYNELGKRIREHGCLSEAMMGLKSFPRGVIAWVQVGEEKGGLGEMFAKASKFMKDDLDYALNIFYATLEPILISIIGIIVGLMVIATLLPISRIAQTGL